MILSTSKNNRAIIARHIEMILPQLKKEPAGKLQKPYLSVAWSDTAYTQVCFGWDAHFVALRLAAKGEHDYLRDHVDNFLDAQERDTGFVPFIRPISISVQRDTLDVYYPLLAQAALVYVTLAGDELWANQVIDGLSAYLGYYESEQQDISGLFYNRFGWSGIDNDAALAFFPIGSVCTPFLNSLMYLEYVSMSKLAALIGDAKIATEYELKAKKLQQTIEELLWSENDNCYAPYRRDIGTCTLRLHDEPLNSKGLGLYSYLSFTNLMPIYAGICEPNRANSIIDRYIASSDHFLSEWGIRSLSRSSEYYNNAIWGFPPRFEQPSRYTSSNWQGPVWFLSTYFVFRGLVHYGRTDLAETVMDSCFCALAADIEKNGTMHENYHAETGAPLYADHFGSWNTLADLLPDELETECSMSDIYIIPRRK
ncbi:MAG: hypothetical protein M1133_10160 [Armatimonadetes bacterium]|nr:hypothetical protein [Armatimonadota bacterium]